MSKDEQIFSRFAQAAEFHGHQCPGLAIGVRAAVEGLRLLEIPDIQDKNLYCVAESMACYIDGIQAIAGCTFGKGNLIYRPTGKCAFNFYHTESGRSVRLLWKKTAFAGDKNARIAHILTAPLDEVFAVGKPRAQLPARQGHTPELVCSLCGEAAEEHMMRIKDGKPVCPDCVEC